MELKQLFKRCYLPALSILIMFSGGGFLFAQENLGTVNIMSPNSASLSKYVDYPVNSYTGVPRISIPIHEVKEGPISLPISLSYHAAGLKVLDQASWVGAGWSLSAGGMVSRTVRGLPDEQVGSLNSPGNINEGSFLVNGGFLDYYHTVLGNQNGRPRNDFGSFAQRQKDGEPDLFFYNFAGYSGEFYFNEIGQAVQLPESDVQIELITKPEPPLSFNDKNYIQGFKLTTPDGVKYYFGITEATDDVDPIEMSDSNLWDPDRVLFSQTISSWYLHRIESADRLFSINLTYENEDYAYYSMALSPCIGNCSNGASAMKVLMNGIRISSITCSNGRVDFIPQETPRLDLAGYDANEKPTENTEAFALNKINISSNSTDFCKSYQFSYSYFLNDSDLPPYLFGGGEAPLLDFKDNKRLKLDALQEVSCNDAVALPAYRFSYYDEASVPRTLSFAQDHWGFYNGQESNLTPFPSTSSDNGENFSQGGIYGVANREAAWPAMRAGALAAIQYPTGGTTTFNYEPNEVDIYPNITDPSPTGLVLNMGGSSAGMGTAAAETSEPFVLEVESAGFYKIVVNAHGNGRGTLDLQGVQDHFAIVGPSSSANPSFHLVDTTVFFTPGAYVFTTSAAADSGSGNGVTATFGRFAGESGLTAQSQIVGGLRVRSIQQKTNGQVVSNRSFDYGQAQLFSIPNYIFKVRNKFFSTAAHINSAIDKGCVNVGLGSNDYIVYVSPSTAHPLVTTQGYHIGYNEVKETQGDGGYTISNYAGSTVLPAGWSALKDVSVRAIDRGVCFENDPVFPAIPTPYDFERGNLRYMGYFTATGELLKSTDYLQTYQDRPEVTFGLRVDTYNQNGTAVPSLYEMQSARMITSSQVNRIFDPNDVSTYVETTQITHYENPAHQLPTRVETSSSRGLEQQEFSYAKDFTFCYEECPSCLADFKRDAALLEEQFNQNLSSCYLDSYSGCRGFQGISDVLLNNYLTTSCNANVGQCHEGAWHNYQYQLNELRKVYRSCISTCQGDGNCLSDGVSSNDEQVRDIFRLDANNQFASPIEIRLKRDGEDLGSTYVEYNSQASDQIYPTKVYQKHTATVAGLSPATIAHGTLVRDDSYEQESEITYEDGVIVEVVPRSGLPVSYIWGYHNNYPIVVAQGVSHEVLSTAYQNDPLNFRNDPTLAKALITTYAYDPMVGMTSEIDPNGYETTYHYDDLGRLLQVKDIDGNVLKQYEYHYELD